MNCVIQLLFSILRAVSHNLQFNFQHGRFQIKLWYLKQHIMHPVLQMGMPSNFGWFDMMHSTVAKFSRMHYDDVIMTTMASPNHQPRDCVLNRLFRRRSKKTSKLRVTGLCAGNSPATVNSPHKGPVTRKMLPFDDVIMSSEYLINKSYQQGSVSYCGSNDSNFYLKYIVCDACGLRSPSFESSGVLYYTYLYLFHVELIMQWMQQILAKSCFRCKKNTWHVESNYILQPPKYLIIVLSIPLATGRWISVETCGLDDVFPDDLGSGPYTPFIIYISVSPY